MSEPLAPTGVSDAPAGAAAALETVPFAVLIDEAWRATRRHARAILLPLVLVLAPAALLMQVLMALWNLQMVSGDPANLEFSRLCGTFVLGGLVMLVFGLYFIAVYGAMMVTVVRASTGEAPSVRAGARFYVRPRVWATDLLAWILTGLGFLACIVPGLLLMAAWALRVPVMVLEGRHGWDALQRSWELLSHNPGRQLLRHPLLKVLLLFILGIVLTYAVTFVVQAPAMIVSQVMIFRQLAQGEAADPQAAIRATLWLTIPAGVLGALAQLAVQLYVDFATTFLYLDQRRRKEGSDLAAALDRLVGGLEPATAGGQGLVGEAGSAGETGSVGKTGAAMPPPP